MKAIKPTSNINATVYVPGSKSYTQRALIAASLAKGRSTVLNALISEDTKHLIKALGQLGATINHKGCDFIVEGTNGKLNTPSEAIYMGNNGTGLRLLAGTVSLGKGTFVLDGSTRMRQRPIQPLIDALKTIGVDAECANGNGCPPVQIEAKGIAGGKAILAAGTSSQFLSSLLLASPYSRKDVKISVQGLLPSRPYVKMTTHVMSKFGVDVIKEKDDSFLVKAPQVYHPTEYVVEGDASSATYFMAAAAICGGKIIIPNICHNSLQGDLHFSDILQSFGCRIDATNDGLEVIGPLSNHNDFSFDLGDVPDMVPALAVVSAFRKGKTVLQNIGHLRVKESDRIAALTAELTKIGATVEEKKDEMTVQGIATQGAEIKCYNDHRIAMSFAAAGLAIDGIVIKDPDCVKKSFPDFWEKLEALY
ncbi:MAG: 3-phosphoshikimate 1-carboxyvinyltransferase [Deltaproteobacteria bacterium]|nr:3-phosphoshikimate 1-carboxyvinyltransferase [Deltaproteobacteria bacterium]